MSKKKNTLKDLDEFLKQQAATLVTPARLSEKIEMKSEDPPVPEISTPAREPEPQKTEATPRAGESISTEKVLNELKALAEKEGYQFRDKFYDLIIQSLEFQDQYLPEDKMLINTALYLKSGERWKEVIREYWRKKKL